MSRISIKNVRWRESETISYKNGKVTGILQTNKKDGRTYIILKTGNHNILWNMDLLSCNIVRCTRHEMNV